MYSVLHDNTDFIIVNKPAFVSVHSDDGQAGFAVQLERQLSVKLYLVHRLDKVTSGLMIFAKSAQSAAEFGALFANRQITKFYLAISEAKPKKKQGTVKGDMVKARRSAWKLLKQQDNPAITRFYSQRLESGFRLFLLKPETGKTHQIRVMMKSLGSPIYGDPIYSSSSTQLADRCYLHAWQLIFQFRGIDYRFKSMPNQGLLLQAESLLDSLQKWSEPDALTWPKA